MIPFPAITAYIALASAATGAAGAWQVQSWRFDSAKLAASEAVHADFRRAEKQTYDASAGFEKARETVRTKFVNVDREVERVVLKNVYVARACLDDDGVRVINESARASDPAAQLGQPMPAAIPAK